MTEKAILPATETQKLKPVEIKTYTESEQAIRRKQELTRQAEALQKEIVLHQSEISVKEEVLAGLADTVLKTQQDFADMERRAQELETYTPSQEQYGIYTEQIQRQQVAALSEWEFQQNRLKRLEFPASDRRMEEQRGHVKTAIDPTKRREAAVRLIELGTQRKDLERRGHAQPSRYEALSFKKWSEDQRAEAQSKAADLRSKADRGRSLELSKLQEQIAGAEKELKQLQVSMGELVKTLKGYQAEISAIQEAENIFNKQKKEKVFKIAAKEAERQKVFEDFLRSKTAAPGSEEGKRYQETVDKMREILKAADVEKETGGESPALEDLKIFAAVNKRGPLGRELEKQGVGTKGSFASATDSTFAMERLREFAGSGKPMDIILLDDEFFKRSEHAGPGDWESSEDAQGFIDDFNDLYYQLLMEKALGLSDGFDSIKGAKIVVLNSSGQMDILRDRNRDLATLSRGKSKLVGEILISRDDSPEESAKKIKKFLVERRSRKTSERPEEKVVEGGEEKKVTFEGMTKEELETWLKSKRAEVEKLRRAIEKGGKPEKTLDLWRKSLEYEDGKLAKGTAELLKKQTEKDEI